MHFRLRWLLSGAIALLAIGPASWFAFRPHALAVRTTPIVTVYPSQQFAVVSSTGYVVAQRKATISSRAPGRLEWLGVAEGSLVKAGEVIARLDKSDVQARVEAARASVKSARAALEQAQADDRDASSSLKRTRDLIAQKSVSPSAFDAAKARADRALAGIANARAALGSAEADARTAQIAVDYTVIRAPFDGVILSKSANVGDTVTPFSSAAGAKGALVSMADVSTLEVETAIAESSLSKVRVGQPCEITLDALPDVRLRGTVSRIAATADRAKSTVMTKVRFDAIDSRVLPQMIARVSFLSQQLTAEQQNPLTAVHPDALVSRNGKTLVFVVRDGKTAEVTVIPGRAIGALTAVTGELRTGENAVLKPAPELSAGAEVKAAAK